MLLSFFRSFFKKSERQQERRVNAEMAYRAQEREFRQYDRDLDESIKKFKRMACEAADNGQKANALRAARFVNKMQAIKEKVVSVRQHFEMLHSLSTIGDIMVRFMDTCRGLGCDFSDRISIKALSNGQMDLETGLNKLSFITECVEQAFAQIEESLGNIEYDSEPTTEADEQMLNEILRQRADRSDVTVEVIKGEPGIEPANSTGVLPGISNELTDHDMKELEEIRTRLKAI